MRTPACPLCRGPGVRLGVMATLIHYRCRNCGMMFWRRRRQREE